MAVFYVPKGTTDLATVSITSQANIYFMEGSQTITAGGNMASFSGHKEVYVDPFCSVSFPSTNPFRAAVNVSSPATFKHAGGGTWYIHIDGSGTDSITTFQGTGTGQVYFVTGGTVTSLEVASGRYWVSENVDVTTIWQVGGQIDQQYKSTRNSYWYVAGGQLNTGRGFGINAKISGGVVHCRRENTSSTLPTTSATATLDLTGGVLRWSGGNLCAGGTITVMGGALDLSQVPASCSAGTLNITAQSRKLSLLESKIPGVTITFTAINEKIGEAASLSLNQTGYAIGNPGGSVAAAS